MIRKLLIKARKENKLTQDGVARSAKISTDRLSKYENGIDCLTIGELERLLLAVGIRLQLFIEDSQIVIG